MCSWAVGSMSTTIQSVPGGSGYTGAARSDEPARARPSPGANEREQADRVVSSGGAVPHREPLGPSPLQHGLKSPGIEGVTPRRVSDPRRPDSFTEEQSRDIMRTIDRRSGGNADKVHDLGRRAIHGMTQTDPYNLRMNYDQRTGAMSIDRQHIYDGKSEWRRVWSGNEPRTSKDPSAAWSLMTRDAGNALIKNYREQPYNNQPPPSEGQFHRGAKDAIDGNPPPRRRDWGLPDRHFRT